MIPVNKLAYQNLSNAMPGLAESEKKKILHDMWGNLGRIVGEYIHIAKFSTNQVANFVEIPAATLGNIDLLKQGNGGGIIFSGHLGNWEVGPKILQYCGLNVSTIYRPLNNPYVERMTASLRGVNLIEKGSKGSRKIIDIIKSGGFVLVLLDQKISEGEPVKFFHDDAITATSIARMALKYKIPLVPARVIRIGNKFSFRTEMEKPLLFHGSGDMNSDSISLTRIINLKLEEWIREYPSQWFWVHNRWKK